MFTGTIWEGNFQKWVNKLLKKCQAVKISHSVIVYMSGHSVRTEELPARTEELSDYGVKESDK